MEIAMVGDSEILAFGIKSFSLLFTVFHQQLLSNGIRSRDAHIQPTFENAS